MIFFLPILGCRQINDNIITISSQAGKLLKRHTQKKTTTWFRLLKMAHNCISIYPELEMNQMAALYYSTSLQNCIECYSIRASYSCPLLLYKLLYNQVPFEIHKSMVLHTLRSNMRLQHTWQNHYIHQFQ